MEREFMITSGHARASRTRQYKIIHKGKMTCLLEKKLICNCHVNLCIFQIHKG